MIPTLDVCTRTGDSVATCLSAVCLLDGHQSERRLPLDGQALAHTDFESTEYDGNDHTMAGADVEKANLITSIVDAGGQSHLGGDFAQHKVVIDIDLPVTVLPSSTPGHHHLFIDKEMSWIEYCKLLEALTIAGIVEPGYLLAASRRGHTAVRLPWVRKETGLTEAESAVVLDELFPSVPPTPDAVDCTAETWSWDHFSSDAVDAYWICCTLTHPHVEHEDAHTGLRWP